ncbi:MAG TPA: 1-acyl-sn-glycerol-3-phosphate acyltransferase, partial [Solirubrobacteraceae bacterium]|nr:1-acyl-sn-glycerol-3-phosphate acyltransferase [Solirubrobacteraceae bacterium]
MRTVTAVTRLGTSGMEHDSLLDRTDRRGVNPLVYWITRALFQPFFHLWFRMSRIGREHVPADGPVILAANHRSFIDPFLIATMVRRPVFFVAKRELFAHRLVAWYLNNLGAFPVDRGKADADAMGTARSLLERGECVVIFPEGTRTRPGALGSPRRGVGRLALETGAPVVPLALIGTEAIRRGWRIRPHKVRLRAGRPLTFPRVQQPSAQLAGAVTERIWPCVSLLWESLGGMPPLRHAAVIGAGSWGTAVGVALARAGVHVELCCRTPRQAGELAARGENRGYLPGVELPRRLRPRACAEVDLAGADLVVLAVPSVELPAAVADHGGAISERAGVLVLAKGLVGPQGTLPSVYVAERTRARAVGCLGGPGHAADALAHGASLLVASLDRGFGHQVRDALRRAGLDVEVSDDVPGVELAGAAKNAAALAAGATEAQGMNAAGAAAGHIFAEVWRFAALQGARPESM